MSLALITGGSSGLGLEIAAKMKSAGIEVLIIGRSKDKLDLAKDTLDRINGEGSVDIYSCNIGIESNVNVLYNYVLRKNATLDYLFNVAGTGMYGSMEEIGEDDIEEVFNSNLKGLMLICKAFVKLLNQNVNGARIINVLSTAALKAKKMESVYYAAKWGARGFTESMKDELKDTKTEVITVYPGGMKTPFWNDSTSGYNTDKFMEPGEVAKVIVDVVLNKNVYISELTINRPK